MNCFNSNVFRFNDQKEFGKSKIERDLLKKYDNIFYPENILEYKDYIVNDMHIKIIPIAITIDTIP